jgi:hypothetical protein
MHNNNGHISIVSPESVDDAARIFRDLVSRAKRGESVRAGILESPYRPQRERVRGGGSAGGPITGGSAGATILLSYGRMDRVLEVSKGDLLAVVEGGVAYGTFARAVKEEGLYFPHEPRIDITIAGMVMDGAIFPTEGSFGGLREYILGLELVTPGGEIVRFGSRAIKDVGGYELIGFLMGQGGRCGMITKVTLRLIAEPCCRAYIAGRGDLRTLKMLAYNARRGFRLASTEIFEGRAAELIVRSWKANLDGRGKPLPPILSGGGESDAVLVGELQGLETVVEDQLLRLAGAGGGASLVLLDEELFGISRRFPFGGTAGRRESFVQVSYDGGSVNEAPQGALVRRSLYPERIDILVPVKEMEGCASGSTGDPVGMIEADPALGRLVSGIAGTCCRERLYLIEREGGIVSWKRMWWQVEALRDLTERIIAVFDPRSVMLP